MDESPEHNFEWKNPDAKGYVLFASIYIKFKTKQNKLVVTEVRRVLISMAVVTVRGIRKAVGWPECALCWFGWCARLVSIYWAVYISLCVLFFIKKLNEWPHVWPWERCAWFSVRAVWGGLLSGGTMGRAGEHGIDLPVLPKRHRIWIFALFLPLAVGSWPVVMVFWASLGLDHGFSTMGFMDGLCRSVDSLKL